MNARAQKTIGSALSAKSQFAFVLIAAAAFHSAFAHRQLAPLILVYLGCLIELTRAETPRGAFYFGLALGFLVFAPKLAFFYNIFGPAAVPLWLVLAFWHALFLSLGQHARNRLSPPVAVLLLPIFWTGLEYFRSELYPLKFSWLAPAFALGPNAATHVLGSYGTTFVLVFVCAALTFAASKRRVICSVLTIIALSLLLQIPPPTDTESSAKTVRIAGMQLEFPVELEVPAKLDLLKQKHPDADIYVLSEYTFDGPIPKCVRAWCKRNSAYLIAGGKDPAPNRDFYNTAFVVDPNGEIIFKQVKAVPIQFFKDGLPAPEQKLWNSPWGKIGLCVCYDLSYTRVIDRLVRQRAQIIINPTMDVADWGAAQHQLHSLIPPMRAAEYRIPIFRLASSGISEAVDPSGRILAIAPFGADESTLAAKMPLSTEGHLPCDRYIAIPCSVIAAAMLLCGLFSKAKDCLPDANSPKQDIANS